MNLVYVHTFRLWVNQDKTRSEQPVDFLRDQFDAMLAIPVVGQASNPAQEKRDFRADYLALRDKE